MLLVQYLKNEMHNHNIQAKIELYKTAAKDDNGVAVIRINGVHKIKLDRIPYSVNQYFHITQLHNGGTEGCSSFKVSLKDPNTLPNLSR